jgi:hypothetical protein
MFAVPALNFFIRFVEKRRKIFYSEYSWGLLAGIQWDGIVRYICCAS